MSSELDTTQFIQGVTDILSSHPLNNALPLYRCYSSGCIFTGTLGQTICQSPSPVLPLRPQESRRYDSFPRSPKAAEGPRVHFLCISEASSLALSLVFDLKVCLTFNPGRCCLNHAFTAWRESRRRGFWVGSQSSPANAYLPCRLVMPAAAPGSESLPRAAVPFTRGSFRLTHWTKGGGCGPGRPRLCWGDRAQRRSVGRPLSCLTLLLHLPF